MIDGNGFIRREYVTWRKICALVWAVLILSITFFTPRAFANDAGNRNGEVLSGAYVEAPSRVTALLGAAKNEEDEDVIWSDLHSGVYDEDIQRDILDLILGRGDRCFGINRFPAIDHFSGEKQRVAYIQRLDVEDIPVDNKVSRAPQGRAE